MNQEQNSYQEQIITKLTTLLEVKYIYSSEFVVEASIKTLIIILLKRNCSSLTHDLSAMVAKIFQEETDFLYRIFSFEYAQQQLKKENLFFIHGCSWDKVIFHDPETELDCLHEYHIPKKTLNIIQAASEKECRKIAAFYDGATFFIKKNNLSHAAYMLHQYIELWFRYAALFTMGNERKIHSIKELQTYI
jgi:HEPN domain-containing protein